MRRFGSAVNQEGYEPGVLIAYKADGLYRSWDEIPGDLVVTSGNYFGKRCMDRKLGRS
ncbi:hypothetical protein NXW59_00195 [Bacteroides fragilis]|nr:hypothetical protein [Bacteroides fragilis]